MPRFISVNNRVFNTSIIRGISIDRALWPGKFLVTITFTGKPAFGYSHEYQDTQYFDCIKSAQTYYDNLLRLVGAKK